MIKKMAIGFAELEQYMEELINEQSSVGDRLSMREVIGHTFIFLIGGHEVRPPTFSFASVIGLHISTRPRFPLGSSCAGRREAGEDI